jgi:glycosyltransferase involved in cell wall biosynthesis
MKKKVTYIISDIDGALAFEWTARELTEKYDLLFLLIGKESSQLERYLQQVNVRCLVVSDARYPSFFSKWRRIFSILRNEKPDVIHAHLWRALLLGLSTAWVLRIKKRIFTRHHGIIHYREHPSGRKWDKICNWLATDIIAISQSVKKVLIDWDGAQTGKVHVIQHGFDFKYFEHDESFRLQSKYGIKNDNRPVIGVIARYVHWKGIQYIIPAFHKLLAKHPNAHLVLANATGNYSAEIKILLRQLPRHSYTEIAFENDLSSLYRLFDVYVHTPIEKESESFGQTYVEALLVGIPSVFTISGVAAEFIRHEYNALVVDYMNVEMITHAVERILDDNKLRDNLVSAGKASIQDFSLDRMISKLQALYG